MTRQQLLDIGFKAGAIKRRLEAGRLQHVHRGVYLSGHQRLSQRGHWLAAVIASGEGAVLSHESAAALWGLVRPRGPADVTCSHGRMGRKGIRLHQAKIQSDEKTERDRIPVTSVARTLFDLAEVVDFGQLKRAWEEADRLNLLKLRAVERVCEQGVGRHGLRPINRLLAEGRAVVRTRSPLEDRFLAFCHDHGLPPPATNVLVLGHEADAYWPAAQLVVELDGFSFHRHHSAFQRDRARDAALQAAGYHSIRVTHYRLDHESATVLTELRQFLGT